MAKDLQALVENRLAAAAGEIFALFEEAVVSYKNEIYRLEKETERQRELLGATCSRQLSLENAQIELVSPDQAQTCASLKEENAKTVKEEQQQMSIQQEIALTIVEVVGNAQESFQQRQTAEVKEEEAKGQEPGGAETGDGLESDRGEQTDNSDSDEEWLPASSSSKTLKDQSECVEKGSTESSNQIHNSSPGTDGGRKAEFEMCECGRVFLDKSDFEKHRETHFKYRPFSCSICEKKFTKKAHVDEHMKIHRGEKDFICTVCDKRFTYKSTLKSHMKKTHDRPLWHPGFRDRVSERPFKCSLCDKTFRLKSYLERHLTIHTTYRPFSCSYCPKSFRWKQELKNHEAIHTRGTKFSCKQCNATFDQMLTLRQHITASHVKSKPFRCTICNRRFEDEASLQPHMTTVHVNALDKPFRCKVCDSQFLYKNNLNSHMKKHNELQL